MMCFSDAARQLASDGERCEEAGRGPCVLEVRATTLIPFPPPSPTALTHLPNPSPLSWLHPLGQTTQ